MKDSREELKELIESEIDGLCIRYCLSDVAKVENLKAQLQQLYVDVDKDMVREK